MPKSKPTDPGPAQEGSFLSRLHEFLKWVTAGEEVPPAGSDAQAPPPPDFLSWLAAREPLPRTRPSVPEGGPAFWPWLIHPEAVPPDPGSGSAHAGPPGFLRWLFASESIPRGLEPGSGGDGPPGFLPWLFSPEPLPTASTVRPEPRENIDGSS